MVRDDLRKILNCLKGIDKLDFKVLLFKFRQCKTEVHDSCRIVKQTGMWKYFLMRRKSDGVKHCLQQVAVNAVFWTQLIHLKF